MAAKNEKSESQPCCRKMLQLALFEPPTKLELSRLKACQGHNASPSQLLKLGQLIPDSFVRKRKHLRVSERKSLGFATVKMKVAVNDLGRAIGEDHAGAKYLDSDVDHARELRAEGYTLREISKMLDMPIRTVRGYLDGSRRSQSVADWKVVKRWRKKC